MDSGLAGKRFLVTGASGGIGRAVAQCFAGEGSEVVLHCFRNRGAAESLAEELAAPATVVQADLRDEGQVDAMFAEIVRAGPVDGIVVNAGMWVEGKVPLHQMTVEQWEGTLTANLTNAFLTCRGFLRHIADTPRDDASIVMVASTAGLFGEAGHADYASAKAALAHGLTTSLKNEIVRLAPRGRVNCVCPGWVRTPMAKAALEEPGALEHVTSTMALRKVAEPEDVARAVVYLSSSTLAGHVSGSIVPVAGGMEGRLLW